MEFSLSSDDLNAALSVASIVSPKSVTNSGESGYLFEVRKGECTIHSQESQRKVRVTIEADTHEGEGSFVLPVEKASALKLLEGRVTFKAWKENDSSWVKYTEYQGLEDEFLSIDPLLIKPFEVDANPGAVFSASLLRESLSLLKGYIAGSGSTPDNRGPDDPFKVIQLFDGSSDAVAGSNGYLFAADRVRAAYFHCKAFEGKAFSIHSVQISPLLQFLSRCDGLVTIQTGASETVIFDGVVEDGQPLPKRMFAWARHAKQHERFAYYDPSNETFVLQTPKDLLVKTLKKIRAATEASDSKWDRVRLHYTHADKTLRFLVNVERRKNRIGGKEGLAIGVVPKKGDDGSGSKGMTEDFAATVNINHLIDIVDPMKSNDVTLRVSLANSRDGGEPKALFRTIEAFYLSDAGKVVIEPGEKSHQCTVTRFIPSR